MFAGDVPAAQQTLQARLPGFPVRSPPPPPPAHLERKHRRGGRLRRRSRGLVRPHDTFRRDRKVQLRNVQHPRQPVARVQGGGADFARSRKR